MTRTGVTNRSASPNLRQESLERLHAPHSHLARSPPQMYTRRGWPTSFKEQQPLWATIDIWKAEEPPNTGLRAVEDVLPCEQASDRRASLLSLNMEIWLLWAPGLDSWNTIAVGVLGAALMWAALISQTIDPDLARRTRQRALETGQISPSRYPTVLSGMRCAQHT
ncbi:hypothetical protein WOLCODRAFT_154065 [Wolfiporia cocos MD-104 SS10]|uniref:Uncharacterized protein n=1 Tax=Wolfiporia cocos (strain MD-104) TaxID=742152 RepID=A0A2H3JQ44_WOLCO|nr:hypothetical protein WOLCODRAFT_154065 [Wolfiporia cocos MD-104 SS10]